MLNLGSVYTGSTETLDGTGALVDPATIGATVTLPDLTTVALTPTRVSVGLYTFNYITTQAGRHVVNWTAASTGVSWADEDVFIVAPADQGWIVGINDVTTFLRNNGLTTSVADYQRVAGFISAASATLTYFVGDIAPTTYDEWYDGGNERIALVHSPVTAITSVIETFGAGNAVNTLTNQPMDGGGPFTSFGYTADLKSGVLTRRVSGVAVPFWRGTRSVHIVYTTGNSTYGADLVQAALEMVRYYWAQSQGAGGAYGAGQPITDFASLPNIVQNKIGRYRQLPGIA